MTTNLLFNQALTSALAGDALTLRDIDVIVNNNLNRIFINKLKRIFIYRDILQKSTLREMLALFLLVTHKRAGKNSPGRMLVADIIGIIVKQYYKILEEDVIENYSQYKTEIEGNGNAKSKWIYYKNNKVDLEFKYTIMSDMMSVVIDDLKIYEDHLNNIQCDILKTYIKDNDEFKLYINYSFIKTKYHRKDNKKFCFDIDDKGNCIKLQDIRITLSHKDKNLSGYKIEIHNHLIKFNCIGDAKASVEFTAEKAPKTHSSFTKIKQSIFNELLSISYNYKKINEAQLLRIISISNQISQNYNALGLNLV